MKAPQLPCSLRVVVLCGLVLQVVRLVAATALSVWALHRKDVFSAPNALAVFGAVNAASAVLVAMHPRLLHCSSTVAE